MDNPLLMVSLGVLFVGIILVAASAMVFRVRALLNKQAWKGATLPLLLLGLPFLVVGMVMVYFTYR